MDIAASLTQEKQRLYHRRAAEQVKSQRLDSPLEMLELFPVRDANCEQLSTCAYNGIAQQGKAEPCSSRFMKSQTFVFFGCGIRLGVGMLTTIIIGLVLMFTVIGPLSFS